ncbi:MAG: MarR family transcriptional regulator [Actinomycetota bacterium]|nr:MarR family transcriptional regulator [Actinomycetota bacterium]
MSRIVDDLVAAGLVRRQPNPVDRRSAYAAITGDGRAQLRRVAPIYLDAIRKHFVAPLDPGHLRVIEAAMSAVEGYDPPATG